MRSKAVPTGRFTTFKNRLSWPRLTRSLCSTSANVYRRQGNYGQSKGMFGECVQIQPDDPEMNYSLGMLYAQQSQSDLAAHYFAELSNCARTIAEAMNNLGVLLVRNEDYTEGRGAVQDRHALGAGVRPVVCKPSAALRIANSTGEGDEICMSCCECNLKIGRASQALEMLQ